jgi:endonuclease/exonuclease/phosphatase (EEP) superfamily protein YafD
MSFLAPLVLALAIAAAAVGTASLGGRLSQTLDIASHFAPVTLVMGLVVAAAAPVIGGGAWMASVALSLIGAAACAVAMAPELWARLQVRSTPAQPGRTLKVVQLNLWRWNRDPEATVRWLEAQAADVVVLQEVIDWALHIPEALERAYPHQSPRIGTRILSRLPVLGSGEFRARSTRTHSTGAWLRIDHPAGAFTVVGFQATWPIPPGPQQADSRDLARRLADLDKAGLIVCGDFNAAPWSASLRDQDRLLGLERRSLALFTWPVQPYGPWRLNSPLPFLALDHVYAGSAWKTVSVTCGPRVGSDHLPVVAVFTR